MDGDIQIIEQKRNNSAILIFWTEILKIIMEKWKDVPVNESVWIEHCILSSVIHEHRKEKAG